MKQRLTLCLLSLLAGALAGPLQNPGFEQWLDDSTPAAWQVEARGRTTARLEPDTVFAGSAACALIRRVAGQGNNSGLLQRVSVGPQTELVAQTWCLDRTADASAGLFVTWRGADTGYLSSTTVRQSSDSAGWQLIADTVTAPPTAAFADFTIRTYGTQTAPGGARVLIDAAGFEPLVPPVDTARTWFVQDSLAARLIDFFDNARASLDYCCYNSSRPDVNAALIRARQRGIALRVITENTRLNAQWVADLRAAGIAVWSDSIGPNSSGYMHNKFAIRDAADSDSANDVTWVATYNPNIGELNADCALELPGAALARLYRLEFEQMWGGTGPVPDPQYARFHTGKRDVLPTHEALVAGIPFRVFFAPQDRVVDTITAIVSRCERQVFFAINAFTYDPLGLAMCDAWSRGRWVGGAMDRAGALDPNSEFGRLRDWGIPIRIDSFLGPANLLHQKLMIVDSQTVIVGSANWSQNANTLNDENIVIFSDPAITARMVAEAARRYAEAGGRYPPAVLETSSPAVARRNAASPVGRLRAAAPLYDACGRRIAFAPRRPGVYFAPGAGGTLKRVLIAR
ncbi:MAG: phospholipase D-like domain-containing protein [bacterium]